jgi:cell division transport system permease protein
MRARMLISEALRSITANLSTTIAATMTVLIGMFLLGLLIALGTWVLAWSDQAKSRLLVKVHFCTPITCTQGKEATAPQIEAVRSRLLAMPEVKSVEFVSKAQALEIMKERTPELVEGLSTNPLPASLEVTPHRGEDVSVIAQRVERGNFVGVEKVNYGKKVAERILDVATVISSIFLVAVIVLVAASTLLIANTIRLSIFARRREIEVMKLVGASNWFVRGPFMIEGLICGLVGSAAAVLLLFLAKEVAVGRIDLDEDGVGAIAFGWNATILVAVGLLLGALGSGLTLRRFLRI